MRHIKSATGYLVQEQKGQVWVFVAILMVCLLGILALAIDGGNAYVGRRKAQNAADAGALAGARLLALDASPAEVEAVATQYAVQRNGADSCQVIIVDSAVTVITTKSVPMFFATVLGVSGMTPSARATARFGSPQQADRLAPIAIKDFDYEYGVEYTIWDDDVVDPDPETTHTISGGHRAWLNLAYVYPDSGSVSNAVLKEWMRNGYSGFNQAGSWISGDPGTRATTIAQAKVGQQLRLVVYDTVQNLYSGKPYFHVKRFAVFEVTEVIATGNPKGIRGKFMKWAETGKLGSGDDGGLRVVNLTE